VVEATPPADLPLWGLEERVETRGSAPVARQGREEGEPARNPYRFKLPKIPRTSARPTCVATVRATLFIAASTTVSRW